MSGGQAAKIKRIRSIVYENAQASEALRKYLDAKYDGVNRFELEKLSKILREAFEAADVERNEAKDLRTFS